MNEYLPKSNAHTKYSRALRLELWGKRNQHIAVYPRK